MEMFSFAQYVVDGVIGKVKIAKSKRNMALKMGSKSFWTPLTQ